MAQDQHLSLLHIRDPHYVADLDQSASDTLARAPPVEFRPPTQPSKNNEVLKLFPDRLIKVSSFIDLNQPSKPSGSLNRHLFLIRNQTKQLASDVDFA
jgi:hypothetical protein